MLIGIVEDYDIGVLGGLIVDDMVDAAAPVGIDGNLNVGKFLFHLEGFVTDVAHGRVPVGENETVSLAFVPRLSTATFASRRSSRARYST